MLRVPLEKITPGMVLARPIDLGGPHGRLLLRRNDEIPMQVVPRLAQMGVQEVWVRHPDLEFLEKAVDNGLSDRQRGVYRQLRINFQQFMEGTASEIDLTQFCTSLNDLFEYMLHVPDSHLMLQKVDGYDSYLMSHSTNVCYLSLVLGMKLGQYVHEENPRPRNDEGTDLQLLGLGCLLHDVGKIKIPSEILNKPTRLTHDEMELVKLHPVYGYEMVKGRVPPAVADVVLNHHQRWNGEGYPRRTDARTGITMPPLSGSHIPVFSRIATVADVYDAATSRRCYSPAKLPVQVLHEMRTVCRGFFDPTIEAAFYEIVPPFPIGQFVTLSDGTEAVVVDFNPADPTRPKVQLLQDPFDRPFVDPSRHEIDLACCDEVDIAYVGDVDVRPFVASQAPAPSPNLLAAVGAPQQSPT